MQNISNIIERYLKKMLAESREGYIEIQRNLLAESFNCAPSQINYVLTTRFTLEGGFVVESRRGGGGYVRISKIPLYDKFGILVQICNLIGSGISEHGARGIVKRLQENSLISGREASLILAAVSRSVLRVALPARDQLRANILKAILIAILQTDSEKQEQ
ncbi:MAG: CtsR family transcriptional regulator [Bacillota bacterium]